MEQIQEYGEMQIAGVFFHDFMAKLKPYVDQGWTYDVDSVQHMLPSTFVVTMKKAQAKQQEPVDNKPVRQQRQQKTLTSETNSVK